MISTASNQVVSDVLTQPVTVWITDQGGLSVGWCQGVCAWWVLMGESEVLVAHCSLKACRTVSVFSLYSPTPPSTPEGDIRLCVLTVLDSKFDAHLAQPENITTLFIALHDENLHVWEAAFATIGC